MDMWPHVINSHVKLWFYNISSFKGDEKVIDDAFKERDPQRHCAMKGLPGRVCFLNK